MPVEAAGCCAWSAMLGYASHGSYPGSSAAFQTHWVRLQIIWRNSLQVQGPGPCRTCWSRIAMSNPWPLG